MKSSLDTLQDYLKSANTVDPDKVIQLFQKILHPQEVAIGLLSDLSGFNLGTLRVVYFVKKRGESEDGELFGDCVCLITTDTVAHLELSNSLSQFWNYWAQQKSLTDIAEIVEEIGHFLAHGKPKTPDACTFRKGEENCRRHRTVQSKEKCNQLKKVFGYNLSASEA